MLVIWMADVHALHLGLPDLEFVREKKNRTTSTAGSVLANEDGGRVLLGTDIGNGGHSIESLTSFILWSGTKKNVHYRPKTPQL